jgi:hypothetical protein
MHIRNTFSLLKYKINTYFYPNNIPRFCKDCIYFIPNSESLLSKSKCSYYPIYLSKKEKIFHYLITGHKQLAIENYDCSTTRSNEKMCGVSAKKYINKNEFYKNKNKNKLS